MGMVLSVSPVFFLSSSPHCMVPFLVLLSVFHLIVLIAVLHIVSVTVSFSSVVSLSPLSSSSSSSVSPSLYLFASVLYSYRLALSLFFPCVMCLFLAHYYQASPVYSVNWYNPNINSVHLYWYKKTVWSGKMNYIYLNRNLTGVMSIYLLHDVTYHAKRIYANANSQFCTFQCWTAFIKVHLSHDLVKEVHLSIHFWIFIPKPALNDDGDT